MQKNNPSNFFGFFSKILFLVLLGTSVVYMIGAFVIFPLMIIGFVSIYVWMRIESRKTWKLEQERDKVWREIGILEKELRSPTRSGDIFQLCNQIDTLKQQAEKLTTEIQHIRLKENVDKEAKKRFKELVYEKKNELNGSMGECIIRTVLDLNAELNLKKLKNGENVKLSVSQITGLIIKLNAAQKNLSYSEFNEIADLYIKNRKNNTRMEMDYREYLRQATNILKKFDFIAAYEKYGIKKPDILSLIDDIRKETKLNEMSKYFSRKEKKEYDIDDQESARKQRCCVGVCSICNRSSCVLDE